jgi:hypothetical protein
MRELPGWRDFAVVQRRDASGCIPTGYEILIRAAAVPGVALDSFQDDFDLDKDRGPTDPARNNFESVAGAVLARYPHVRFRRYAFPQGRGSEKLAFIESCLAAQRPVLVSLSMAGAGLGRGWHIMLAIGESDEEVLLLSGMLPDRKGLVVRIPKEELVRIHDNFPGGDDVAVLDSDASA